MKRAITIFCLLFNLNIYAINQDLCPDNFEVTIGQITLDEIGCIDERCRGQIQNKTRNEYKFLEDKPVLNYRFVFTNYNRLGCHYEALSSTEETKITSRFFGTNWDPAFSLKVDQNFDLFINARININENGNISVRNNDGRIFYYCPLCPSDEYDERVYINLGETASIVFK